MSNLATVLKTNFSQLLSEYHVPNQKIEQLWLEIKNKYSENHRYYHNLSHLEHLLQQISAITPLLKSQPSVLFTLYYHDIIYDPKLQDNEEQSALFAEQRLSSVSLDEEVIESCRKMILATKSHYISEEADFNYFTDADLSILGVKWEKYYEYAQNIRKEYSIYPDAQYFAGRKKVLNHFLSMPQIFKTAYFYEKLEAQSRKNLVQELSLLQ